MAESNRNVWAPWRMEYIVSVGGGEGEAGCFLCRYAAEPQADAANHVVLRTPRTLVLLNRFPYTNGHLMIAPLVHVADPAELGEDVLIELALRLRDAKRLLDQALSPQGYNIGMNLGRCAGAGLPEHLHWHVVPRWGGDTNYMSVVGDTRVIPQALEGTYAQLCQAAARLGLPMATMS